MPNFIKPDVNNKLFKELLKQRPLWWQNLLNDKELYINIRQDNHINVYYHGGSLLNLEYTNSFKAKIHFEYIPLTKYENNDYVPLYFDSYGNIQFPEIKTIKLDNFNINALNAIKKRISHFYGPSSEKGIQASFVLNTENGGFIDTEFQPVSNRKIRFDMVWVDVILKKIFFIELKTIEDARLVFSPDIVNSNNTKDNIYKQIKKYHEFIEQNKQDITEYYQNIFEIEKNLDILPEKLRTTESLKGFAVETKPILLVGNCTLSWIKENKNTERINNALKDIAFGCFYQGKATREFRVPEKSEGYKYVFNKIGVR